MGKRSRVLVDFCKNQTVLFVSGLLAFLSCFFVPPSAAYVGYIDFRVLTLLFCLMLVVAGLRTAGTFRVLTEALLRRLQSLRAMVLLLTLLSFGLSMFLTNDVTLITLLPFTLMLFRQLPGHEKLLIHTLVLETVAANLGSMLTPIGNPQNLFLYTHYDLPLSTFFQTMGPYTVASLAMCLLLALTVTTKQEPITTTGLHNSDSTFHSLHKKRFAYYMVLFCVCLFSVARVLDYRVLLVIILLAVLFENRRLFRSVDYSLLLTFLFFFVFIGNMGNLPAVRAFLETMVQGREVLTAVLASQAISNVPAAILLANFTEAGEKLLIGTNLGGLGTLIASMASLITFRSYSASEGAKKGRYFLEFTLVNLLFLLVLLGLTQILT